MKLAVGTAQIGLPYGVANRSGQVSRDEAAAILALARARGIDTLDTAIAYGESEQRLGEIGVAGWRVVSKLPGVPDGCRDVAAWVEAETRGSLSRLGIHALHGLLLHRPSQLREPFGPELWRALEALRAGGLVKKIGVSIYEPGELDGLPPGVRPEIVQAPFNVLDRRLLDTGWLARLDSGGVEVHVRSVFLQGLLLMRPADRPAPFRRWQPFFDAFDRWVAEVSGSALDACLGYVLSVPGISRVVVGVDREAQLAELLDVRPHHASTGALPSGADPDLLNPGRWTLQAG